MPQTVEINGIIRYRYPTALLEENELTSLLALDVPPHGKIQKKDIVAAHNYLKWIVGKEDGDSIRVLGFRDEISSRPLILIVRIINDGR
jgi:hypothetical protein